MDSKRLFYILTASVVLLGLAFVGAAYELNTLFKSHSATLARGQNQIAILEGQEKSLSGTKADIKKYQGLANIAKSIVPQDKDQAQTVSEITKLAGQNGITLSSITFPTSSLGIATPSASTSASSAASTSTPSAAAASKTALSQLTPVAGISGVYSLQIIVQADAAKNAVPYTSLTNFLKALEHNRRTALVTAVTITPNADSPDRVGFSLTLEEYIKP